MNNNNKTKAAPLLHISAREPMSAKKVTVLYFGAIALAIAVGGVFIALLGVNPLNFYAKVVSGCFQSKLAFTALMRIIMPLCILALGVSVAFKMKFWNIGAEGQFIIGAVCATGVGLFLPELPHIILIPLMALSAMLGAGLWGLLVAYFNCRYRTNETLLTLMLNYIALYIVQYLRDGAWRDPAAGGFPKISQLPRSAWIDQLWGIDLTFVVVILLTVFMFFYLHRTKHGYEISVVGDSKNTARYAGMDVNKIIMRTMFLSAAVCGLAGMLQVAGDATSHTLTTGIASGIGFTAIIVAWLAKLNPFGALGVSILFGILQKGCGVAKSTFYLSSAVADILQGIILFVILGFDFFITYKVTFRAKAKPAAEKTEENK